MNKWLLLLVVIALCSSKATADQGDGNPPIVEILNFEGTEVDTIEVNSGEVFTLIGTVSGTQPFEYGWYQDGSLIADTQVIWDYTITVPGMHEVALVAVDVNGLAGSDTCYVVVAPATVPNRTVSWGAIKELYRLH